MEDHTQDGKKLRLLTVLDEFTREGLHLEVQRSMGAKEVEQVLRKVLAVRGAPEFVRCDNGKEFTAKLVKQALKRIGSDVAQIAPGSPWQNGKNERFNGILSQELLSREVWGSVKEAQVMGNEWLKVYNEKRPHGALKLKTPSRYAKEAREQGQWYLPETITP